MNCRIYDKICNGRMSHYQERTFICSRRRDQIIQHVFDTCGAGHVAGKGTINRYRPKSALNDVVKAHDLDPVKVRELSNQLPRAFWRRFAAGADGKSTPPFAVLRTANPSPTYQAIFDEAEAIIELPCHISMHPGGVFVSQFNRDLRSHNA